MQTIEIPQDNDCLLPANLEIAVIIPCYNEAVSIGKVVRDFRAALPQATIYVYDNNSSDDTVGVASQAGAVVRRETRQGKGFVVRRMFADVEADIYVMIDGDNTYDASAAPRLVGRLVSEGLDVVNGARVETEAVSTAYRPGHAFGNAMLSGCVRTIFGTGFDDMLSGYRVFSRRFVKSFPAVSTGFEIETEITVHSLEMQMPAAEMGVPFRDREAGSESKLRTISDGIRILWAIAKLLKRERPVMLFGAVGLLFVAAALALVLPVLAEYFETGLVPRVPSLIVGGSFGIIALLCLFCGIILDTVTMGRKEAKRIVYLAVPGVLEAIAMRQRSGTFRENA
ncbi:Glycosyltransferase [Limimaricola hongkongensis DSM 17492]|uniref:Glycosyltransferase n=2 Tax=Limimaricola hongkongensis TaxID=278132 RepID=A0A017HAQ0_9RHOB|nr:Glycosyltransferase [Limimaricola hongkongensis DSM 17492]